MRDIDIDIALTRRDKNDYYLSVAKAISYGSSCAPGKQHGCLAVKHCRIVSTGFNGPPSGHKHCGLVCPLDVYKKKHGKKDFTLCPAVHSEINCIITAAIIGTALRDSVFYVTKKPCPDCMKALHNMQLAAIVYLDDDDASHHIIIGKKEHRLYG